MLRLFSVVIISIVLIYTIEGAVKERVISGKVTHVGSNEIDKNARVEVSLRDVSLMDTASKLIATATLTNAKTFPVSYELTYNPSDIKAHHTYAMSVRITAPDGKLLFINDVQTHANFVGSTAPKVDVPVIRVGGSPTTGVSKPTPGGKACGPVKCRGPQKKCPYGYQKLHGCEICRCHDPCNPTGKPILCGRGQRCFVDKKADGTFESRCGSSTSSTNDKDKKMDSKVLCNQPKVIGQCRASLPRFYYNSTMKKCEAFNYGGCGGNGNNFHTLTECQNTCKA